MEVIESKVEMTRTGFFYHVGEEHCGRQWFCCHGYGQLADRMIRKFDRRVSHNEKVLCVEAPNKFYWKGVNGYPVATWMTKRHRLDEIKDNNNYLSKVYENEISPSSERILFGFSQGGTILWRWIFEHRPEFDIFINYAGWIPEDIELFLLKDYLANKKLIFVYGSNDEYLNEEKVTEMSLIIKKSTLDIDIIVTSGDHSVDRDIIDRIVD